MKQIFDNVSEECSKITTRAYSTSFSLGIYFLNKTIIQAFDDNYIIAGNSTIGYEIYREYKNIDKIFVPIGGGGCIAGIIVAIKYLDPNIKIIGVQAENTSSMYESIKQNKLITLKILNTLKFTIMKQFNNTKYPDIKIIEEITKIKSNLCYKFSG